jgi:hypothetical protein
MLLSIVGSWGTEPSLLSSQLLWNSPDYLKPTAIILQLNEVEI